VDSVGGCFAGEDAASLADGCDYSGLETCEALILQFIPAKNSSKDKENWKLQGKAPFLAKDARNGAPSD
jgi:hypothetical protein